MKLVLNQIKRGMKNYLKRVKDQPNYKVEKERVYQVAAKVGIKLKV